MAEYLILIYENEESWATASAEMGAQMSKDHAAFAETHRAAIRGGNALHPTTTATCLRRDGAGDITVTDGAFAETKEALGGYYLVEAADLDEAIAIARDVPSFFGSVEVRPVLPVG